VIEYMAYKRRIGKIKVDFFNMRVEFSPNIEILSKKSANISGGSDIEEVTLSFEMMNNITPNTKPEYKTYVLSTDEIEDDEPFDLKEPWYRLEGTELQIVKQDTLPDSGGAPMATSAPSSAPALTPAPTPAPAPIKSPGDTKKIQDLEQQIASIQNMVNNLDNSFSSGSLAQDEYLKKKNFLAEKLGTLMGQLDQIR
jgi:hypothetical protein